MMRSLARSPLVRLAPRGSMSLLAAAILLSGGGGCGEHAKVERPINVKVAILPEYSLPVMMDRYAPLIARMQEAAGPRYRIEWISCPSPETFLATVENERPAIGIQDAFHTALLQKLQDADPVLQTINRDGHPVTRGVLIVRDGSEGIGPQDRIAVASRRSFLFASQMDAPPEERLVPAADSRFAALRWQDEVVKRVRDGSVAAGMVDEDAVGPGVHVISRTPPMPSTCVVVFPQADDGLASILCSALEQMWMSDPADRQILEKLGVTGFIPIDREGAAIVRALGERHSIPY